jgi:hypothetical protein
MDTTREPVLTPRLLTGLGLIALGLGLMFFFGKVLPAPVAAGIAGGIAIAVIGFVLSVVESLREPPERAAGTESPRKDPRSTDMGGR